MARQHLHVRKLVNRLKHKEKSKKYHSIDSKLKILNYSDQHGKHSAARMFKVKGKQIRNWNQYKQNWESMTIEEKQTLRFSNSKHGAYNHFFEMLYDYVKDCLNENIPITTDTLIKQLVTLNPSLAQ